MPDLVTRIFDGFSDAFDKAADYVTKTAVPAAKAHAPGALKKAETVIADVAAISGCVAYKHPRQTAAALVLATLLGQGVQRADKPGVEGLAFGVGRAVADDVSAVGRGLHLDEAARAVNEAGRKAVAEISTWEPPSRNDVHRAVGAVSQEAGAFWRTIQDAFNKGQKTAPVLPVIPHTPKKSKPRQNAITPIIA